MLPAAALDILDEADARPVLEHLKDCEECTRLLDEYREVGATLPLLLPEQHLDPERSEALRARLLSRVSGRPQALGVGKPATTVFELSRRSSPGRWTAWMGWMVAAGLAGVLLVHHSVHRPVAYGWLVAGGLTVLVIGLGVYVRVQHARLSALCDRLAAGGREEQTRQESSHGSRT